MNQVLAEYQVSEIFFGGKQHRSLVTTDREDIGVFDARLHFCNGDQRVSIESEALNDYAIEALVRDKFHSRVLSCAVDYRIDDVGF